VTGLPRDETIHPKISAIQEHLNIIDRYIRDGAFLPALRESYLAIIEMKPSDRPVELMEKIKLEIRKLTHATPGEQKRIYVSNEWAYIDHVTNLSDKLWESKYFNNNKYGASRSLKELRNMAGDKTVDESDLGDEEE
jgi:hypothetical protein